MKNHWKNWRKKKKKRNYKIKCPPPPTMHGTKSFHTELDVMHRAVVLKRVQSYVWCLLHYLKKKKKQLQKSYRGKFQQQYPTGVVVVPKYVEHVVLCVCVCLVWMCVCVCVYKLYFENDAKIKCLNIYLFSKKCKILKILGWYLVVPDRV